MKEVIESEWTIEENMEPNEHGSIGIDISAPDARISKFITIWCGDEVGKDDTEVANLVISAPDLLRACIEAEKHHQGLHSEIGILLRDVIKKATK